MIKLRRRLRQGSASRQIFIKSCLISGLIGALLFGLGLQKIEHLPLDATPNHFSASNAHSWMTQLSKKFPYRVTWGEPRKRAAVWLKSEFSKMGYQPRGMQFSEVIADKQYTDLENIYAEKRGSKHPDEIIIVSAHYDITDTTIEGAMDDASGVGIVLELARVFAQVQTDRTVIFLLTDSEEFGALWGAHRFTRDFERADQIVATASLDFVAPEKQTKILTLCDGLKQGYTPLWLRELALDSLRSVTAQSGVEVVDLSGFLEFIERALQIPPADHGAFLAAGIPAFNWVGQSDHFAHEMAHFHHTPFDVAEALEVESFAPFGQGAERLIRSIDQLNHIPTDFRNSSYWKISETRYLQGWVVTLLHILAFIPFLAYCLVKFRVTLRHEHQRARVRTTLRNEAKGLAILLGSLLLGYVIILLLPTLKIITQYEIFPATQKSLLLYSPNFVAILVVIGSVLLVNWIFKRTFAAPEDRSGDAEVRQALHLFTLTVVIFLAFLKNSYLAVLLLLPPAYFWMIMRGNKQGRQNRFLNALLLAAGSITFVAMAIVMGTIFDVGVVYWYLFLSAAYGLISAYSVVLFFMALAVMIRLFRATIF